MTSDKTMVEEMARALYEHWVAEDFANEYAEWELLGDKETWLGRAQAAATIAQRRVEELREALEEISAFQANGSGANYYFEETWRLVDIARAALNPKGE